MNDRWWPFERARKYMHALNLPSTTDWQEWNKPANRPSYMPANPAGVYKDDWASMRDWLGNAWLTYDEARKYMIKQELRSSNDFKEWCTNGNRPLNIPSSPDWIYRDVWQDWTHFLGSEKYKRHYRPVDEARAFVVKQKISNQQDWFKWCQAGNSPKDIPTNPHYVYVHDGQWKGWRWWLGPNRRWLSYEECVAFIKDKGLYGQSAYGIWFKENNMSKWKSPKGQKIPSNPTKTYSDQWKNWNHFLTCTSKSRFIAFKDARAFTRLLNLTSHKDWLNYCKSGQKPKSIPANPYVTYKKKFKGWPDWLDVPRSKNRKRKMGT